VNSSRIGRSFWIWRLCQGRRASDTRRRFTRTRVQVMICLAWNPPGRRPWREGGQPRDACSSTFPDLTEQRLDSESTPLPNERHPRPTPFDVGFLPVTERHASPSILRKCGGHGASPRPATSSFAANLSSVPSEPDAASMPCVRVANFRETLPHRQCGKVPRPAVGNFVPMKRSR